MTEHQTSDREKKIAEIREGYKSERDDNFAYKKGNCRIRYSFPPIRTGGDGTRIREERAAHNAHVTELCETEKQNRQMREMLDEAHELIEQGKRYAIECERLQQERNKLIEGLRYYANTENWRWGLTFLGPVLDDKGQRARDILKECGVTVE